ncbi:MAG: DUF1080 domain-containing protein [Treponema sp.]|jgi:hypothetical protein|nr:DUF1080 domain-containing protein [Treponema sp.]
MADKGRALFDGASLKGWHTAPRLPTARYPGGPEPDTGTEHYRTAASTGGAWSVIDGVVTGAQGIKGYGGYLLTDEKFADFELSYDAKPDWPVDTGLLVRTTDRGTQGFQILLDHRKSGAIGGFYGNGISGFHAVSFNVDVRRNKDGGPEGLIIEKPETTLEPVTPAKRALLSYAIDPEEFLKTWKWNDWNSFQVRCVGEYPVLTTWINGVKAYELDTGKINWPDYDKAAIAKLLGRAGRISLEVHDNDPGMGEDRWAPGAVCRWKNIFIREL